MPPCAGMAPAAFADRLSDFPTNHRRRDQTQCKVAPYAVQESCQLRCLCHLQHQGGRRTPNPTILHCPELPAPGTHSKADHCASEALRPRLIPRLINLLPEPEPGRCCLLCLPRQPSSSVRIHLACASLWPKASCCSDTPGCCRSRKSGST